MPEISRKTEPKLDTTTLLALVQRAQATLGASKAVPMLLGPITLARLATLEDTSVEDVVAKLQPVYQQLLQRLAELKVRCSTCILTHTTLKPRYRFSVTKFCNK